MKLGAKAILTLVAASLSAQTVVAAERPAKPDVAANPNQVLGNEITAAQRDAVERGLAYLAGKQQADGSFALYGGRGHAGITALAGIAFMSAGNLPGRGKYGE